MQIPVEITLRDIPHSEAVETRIREKIEKLDRFHERVMSCRVTVESPQQKKHQGKLYSVHIDMKVPGGGELVVNRAQNEDIYVAIRDAFNAAGRQLEDHVRRQRGDVKTHDVPHIGRVIQMFPAQGYGFIETPDRRQIYFHRNSVAQPGFDRLEIGTEVEYVEEMGNEGPQARMVSLGKHHVPG
ncbi:MAG TPA: ribosome-associated translation inhibitor RaiA [Acidiferrobacterales bacterium]|nr:ribosome-associated translation inhibitor RaiA [Acidiferrobacterales bacterium]